MAEGSGGVLRELLAVFSFGVSTKELKHGENELEKFFDKVQHFAHAFAGAFAAHQIFEFAEAQAHLLDKIEDTAHALGVTTEAVQEYQYASEALGDDADKLLNSMGRLQVSQQAAADGSKAQSKAFHDLGVQVKSANGEMKSADELFADVAEGIKNTEDPSKAAAIAVKLFGKSGREMLPFLKEGRAGIEELRKEFKELGGGYTEKAIKAGAKFDHQMAKWHLTLKAIKSQLLSALFPALTKLVDWGTKIARSFAELAGRSRIFEAAMVVLGAAATYFAIQMAIAAAPILLMVAAIALLIAVVDDIIVTMRGGDSLIRRFVDSIFGEGYTAEHVELLRDAWREVVSAVKEAYGWLKKNRDEIAEIVDILPPFLLAKGLKAAAAPSDTISLGRYGSMKRPAAQAPKPSDLFDMQADVQGYGSPMVVNNNVSAPVTVNAQPGHEKAAGDAVADSLGDAVTEGWGVLQQVPSTPGQ